MATQARRYADIKVGDTFSAAMTVTARHLSLGAAMIGDFNPLHVDHAFAARAQYGSCILHGVLTSAIMGAPLGMVFAGTAIGYLEHNCSFLAPVRVGDSLTTTWTVTGTESKPRHDGGLVHATADCVNQKGVVVARANGAMLVANRPIA